MCCPVGSAVSPFRDSPSCRAASCKLLLLPGLRADNEWSVRGWKGLAMLVQPGSSLKAVLAPEQEWGVLRLSLGLHRISAFPFVHFYFSLLLPPIGVEPKTLIKILHVRLHLNLLPQEPNLWHFFSLEFWHVCYWQWSNLITEIKNQFP